MLAVIDELPSPASGGSTTSSKRTRQPIGADRMGAPIRIYREPRRRRHKGRPSAQDRTADGKVRGNAFCGGVPSLSRRLLPPFCFGPVMWRPVHVGQNARATQRAPEHRPGSFAPTKKGARRSERPQECLGSELYQFTLAYRASFAEVVTASMPRLNGVHPDRQQRAIAKMTARTASVALRRPMPLMVRATLPGHRRLFWSWHFPQKAHSVLN